MNPIKFKESNVVFAENQSEYLPLPAFKDVNGIVITCWKLSVKERLKILFGGKIWLSMMTFNKPLTPVHVTTYKSDVL